MADQYPYDYGQQDQQQYNYTETQYDLMPEEQDETLNETREANVTANVDEWIAN